MILVDTSAALQLASWQCSTRSIVVLAEKHGAIDVLSFDLRHFRAMRGPGGLPFRLLPDDYPATAGD